jgi:hypothetical protein
VTIPYRDSTSLTLSSESPGLQNIPSPRRFNAATKLPQRVAKAIRRSRANYYNTHSMFKKPRRPKPYKPDNITLHKCGVNRTYIAHVQDPREGLVRGASSCAAGGAGRALPSSGPRPADKRNHERARARATTARLADLGRALPRTPRTRGRDAGGLRAMRRRHTGVLRRALHERVHVGPGDRAVRLHV